MSTEEKEGKARNEEIENQLKRDRLQQRNEIKMLLLGTSTSPSPGGLPRVGLSRAARRGISTWDLDVVGNALSRLSSSAVRGTMRQSSNLRGETNRCW